MAISKINRVYLVNIPQRYHAIFRKYVISGLVKARKVVEWHKPIEVLIFAAEWHDRVDFETYGEIFSEKSIVVYWDTKHSQKFSAKRLKQLESTIIHEFIHCVRDRFDVIENLADKFVEEGMSCFFQTRLSQPPPYLDLGGSSEVDIWRWWKYFYPHLRTKIKKIPKVESDRGLLEASYRIAYFIIYKFWDTRPRMHARKFVHISRKKVMDFARHYFADPRNKP